MGSMGRFLVRRWERYVKCGYLSNMLPGPFVKIMSLCVTSFAIEKHDGGRLFEIERCVCVGPISGTGSWNKEFFAQRLHTDGRMRCGSKTAASLMSSWSGQMTGIMHVRAVLRIIEQRWTEERHEPSSRHHGRRA